MNSGISGRCRQILLCMPMDEESTGEADNLFKLVALSCDRYWGDVLETVGRLYCMDDDFGNYCICRRYGQRAEERRRPAGYVS